MAWYVKNLQNIKFKYNGTDIDTPAIFYSYGMTSECLNTFRTKLNTTTGNINPSYSCGGYGQAQHDKYNLFKGVLDSSYLQGAFLDGDFLSQYLRQSGDVLTMYNANYGTLFRLEFRYYQHQGSSGNNYDEMRIYYNLGGNAATIGANYAFKGVDRYGRDRHFYFGVLTDIDKAEGYFYTIIEASKNDLDECTINASGPDWVRSDWNAYKYLCYLFFSDVYVPPTPPPPSTDPYDAGGTSTTDPQGTGDFDDSSDAITAPAMTSLSPIDADFIKLYKIDKPNLTAFAQYLFSASFTTNLEKMWNSVSEAILCLNLLPFTPAGTASTATDIIFDSSDSNADGYLITQQYEELDFGSVTISEFYGSCLDYTPYTQIQLSLPYAQTINLDPDEFMGRSVGVKCRVDVYTGSALYLIDNGTSVLMQVPATLANPLPWSAKDYSAVISSIANLAITVGGGLAVLATGGASTPAAIAIAGGVAANTASNVMQAKPHYQHGGSAGMGTGMFGIQKPYLIIKRPRQCLPVDNNKYQGYPSMATLLLGHLSGFTKVLQIHLDNLPATDAEKKELETILKGGVWF